MLKSKMVVRFIALLVLAPVSLLVSARTVILITGIIGGRDYFPVLNAIVFLFLELIIWKLSSLVSEEARRDDEK